MSSLLHPCGPPASLNMARFEKATPHACAALTSATINTAQKSMKSLPSYEIPPPWIELRVSAEKVLPCQPLSECEGNVRGAYIYSCLVAHESVL